MSVPPKLRTALKILLWTFFGVVVFLLTLPILFYIPVVQDFAKNIALKEVKKSTGMDIGINTLCLRFPLKLELNDVYLVEASGDTMLTAGCARVTVKPLPLLRLNIDVSGIELDDASYRLGTPDSSLYLTARVRHFEADSTSLGLKQGTIDLGNATLHGGEVRLALKSDTTVTPVDTAASTPWKINVGRVNLDSINYSMTMLPTIDSLGTVIRSATLVGGSLDMATKEIRADSLGVTIANATYLLPTVAWLKANPTPPTATLPDTISSGDMWRIYGSRVNLIADTATYAVRDARPLPGLDMNYLQASKIYIDVDSFYNCGVAIRVPLRTLKARERCGISLNASGIFSMDSSAMHADKFRIVTDYSRFTLQAMMGMGDLTADPRLPLALSARADVAVEDIEMAMPSIKPMLKGIPRGAPIAINANINGTAGNLNVNTIELRWPRFLIFNANGRVENPFDFNHMGGRVNFKADAIGLNAVKPTLLDAQLARTLNIPHTLISGKVDYHPGRIAGAVTAVADGGRIALDGKWNQRAEGYDARIDIDRFPVDAFMPSLGVGKITANLSARGHGYNPMDQSTEMDVDMDVVTAEYLNRPYQNILLTATLHDGSAQGHLRSANPEAFVDLDFLASIADGKCNWDLSGDVANLDLKAMNLSETPLGGSLSISSDGSFCPDSSKIDASLTLSNIRWQLNDIVLSTPRINADVATSDTTVKFTMRNGDLAVQAAASCGLDSLLSHFTASSELIDSIIRRRRVDIPLLQRTLPRMMAVIDAGPDNIVSSYLETSNMGLRSLNLAFSNDSLMNFDTKVLRFRTGSMTLDTIRMAIAQHSGYLVYRVGMHNRRGNLDNFSKVTLSGYIAGDRMSALLRQENLKGEKGFQLGMGAEFSDSLVSVKFVPYNPTIGYKPWTINRDNFVKYSFADHHLDADLQISSDESYLRLFTEHTDSTAHTIVGSENVVLQMANIELKDWLAVSPFSPPISGELGADMRFNWNTQELTGRGTLDLDNLYYGHDRVGSFTLGVDLANGHNGLHADVALMVDSIKVITARGVLNDTTALNPFLLDFSMIRFPLHVVNPFLPKEYADLSGVLNGQMEITGDMAHPIFNGYIDFDTTAVKVPMLGSSFSFSEEKIPVDSNVVYFNNFSIHGSNSNPLLVNGTVDARELSNVKLDLDMKARNIQVVNTTRPRDKAQLYGKGYLNFDADVKGNMSRLNVDAAVNVLPETNVTYIIEESTDNLLSSQNTTSDMVTFVEFNDSTKAFKSDSIIQSSMSMNLNASLIISQGSTINVDIPGDGQNKATIQGEGNLQFSMTPLNNGRLTGRFTINNGFARYSPPMISLLNFTFVEGSYIAFTGDMFNPTLNISAYERKKANITAKGETARLVDFILTITASNTLENLDVKFDLSCDNDLTISNELASMTPTERAAQAMNLLVTGTYSGATEANSNLSGNTMTTVFSFLTNRLNSWLADNIRGVDLSFGMDQYETGVEGAKSTTTSYSYSVSKSLFNDRFKIVVGGNYSTDADADENFAQNLISDISFEYLLNKSGSMYVRLFRHTGFESILEGEITQTGVGFVYKRKVRSLRDVFKFLIPRRKKPIQATPEVQKQEK